MQYIDFCNRIIANLVVAKMSNYEDMKKKLKTFSLFLLPYTY